MDFLDRVKNFMYDNKSNFILGGVLIGIILCSNFIVYFTVLQKINNNKVVVQEPCIEKTDVKEESEKVFCKVDIKGAIKKPGVYKLEKDKRVMDVISLAGGLLENADTRVNNLSKYVQDEMVIVIYTKEEVDKFHEVKEKEKAENKACQVYNEDVINNSCIDMEESKDVGEVDTKISINTASLELLMTLPGIGEAKAKTIIEYREKTKFEKIEDLMNVSGIGEKAFEKIKEYITI